MQYATSLANRTNLRRWPRLLIAVAVVFVALSATGIARAEEEKKGEPPTVVSEWLLLGPVDLPLPLWNEGEEKVGSKELLEWRHLPDRQVSPHRGDRVHLIRDDLTWTPAPADTDGVYMDADTTSPRAAWLCAYVTVPRWTKLDVKASGSQAFQVWVGTESVAKNTGAKKNTKSGTVKLSEGTYRILVKTVFMPGDTLTDWRVGVTLTPDGKTPVSPALSLDPTRNMNIGDVLDGPAVSGVQLSPDGAFAAISMWERSGPEGERDAWTEIRLVANGDLVRVIRDTKGSSWQWAPDGSRLSYVTRDKKMATVRLVDLETGEIRPLLEDIENFESYEWSPDGTFIAYTVGREAEKSKNGVIRLRGLGDRRAGERDRSYVYIASVPEGLTRRITAGERSNWVYDIHPDGTKMLLGRTWEDLSVRGYSPVEMVVLDLADMSTRKLGESPFWFSGAQWSPDGKQIVVIAGASAFDGVGRDLPDDVVANDYDYQAFIIDAETGEVDPFTKTFDPTVRSVYWPKPGRYIYLAVGEGEYGRLYRYDTNKREFKRMEIDADEIGARGLAEDKPVAIVAGEKVNRAVRLYRVDLKSGRSSLYLDPPEQRFADVTLGEVKDFNFTMPGGTEIVGRYYLPPHFDPDRKYPCIVYYYGGTSAVTRNFGGRYPKNLWAAHGYVVYVMQPSGAPGFGQAFSAVHVNDWGKTTSGEIIEGTQQFLASHPFVDPKRVGCIGASFGGFMTELLVTKTDIYAAAVSHAGISDISSYWGEGYWGYGYNAVAAANSFPWNRKDIYVDQSPLFGVENVTTPLLLLHGDADTNVPPGESEQMYAALKLLGKEVEYIRVEGQNHWIVDYEKRKVWSDAIISWFDRWLKDEPQWWNDSYPPLDENTGEPATAED